MKHLIVEWITIMSLLKKMPSETFDIYIVTCLENLIPFLSGIFTVL